MAHFSACMVQSQDRWYLPPRRIVSCRNQPFIIIIIRKTLRTESGEFSLWPSQLRAAEITQVQMRGDFFFYPSGFSWGKKTQLEMGMVAHGSWRQGDQEFKICLSYIVSSRPAWTAWGTLLKQKQLYKWTTNLSVVFVLAGEYFYKAGGERALSPAKAHKFRAEKRS